VRCFGRQTGKKLRVGHQKQGKEKTFVATVERKQHIVLKGCFVSKEDLCDGGVWNTQGAPFN
jgi:hypothetical protein